MYIDIKIEWKYGNQTGECIDTFGYDTYTLGDIKNDIKNGWYWYEEGNGSCDCNRSLITGLAKEYDDHWPCGEKIEFLKLTALIDTISETKRDKREFIDPKLAKEMFKSL